VGHISVAFDGTPAEIVVYNDGNRFTHITQSTLDYVVGQDIDCGSGEKVRHAVLAAGAYAISTDGGTLGAAPRAWMETHAGAQRAVRFPVDLADYYAAPFGSPNPVEICNREVDRRVGQGQSRIALLQHGFTVTHPHVVSLAADCTDKNDPVEPLWDIWPEFSRGWKHATDQAIGTIRCKGTQPTLVAPTPGPPSASNDLAVPFQVRSVRVRVDPAHQRVICPATVDAVATFEVVGTGTVRYRGNVNGGLGPVKTLNFDHSASREVPIRFEVGRGPGGGSPPSGPGGVGIGGGLAPPPGSEDGPEEVTGWVKIVIVSPEAGVNGSKKAHYTVECRDVPTITAQPFKPDDAPAPRGDGRRAGGRKAAGGPAAAGGLRAPSAPTFGDAPLPLPAALVGQLGLPAGSYELRAGAGEARGGVRAGLSRDGKPYAVLGGRPQGCTVEQLRAIPVGELIVRASPRAGRETELVIMVRPRLDTSCAVRLSGSPTGG
jgi:hypothetical protein